VPVFHVSNRQLVLPGQLLAEGEGIIVTTPLIYRSDDKFYSVITGLVQVDEKEKRLGIVPLEGAYMPKPGDTVIGVIDDVGLTYWSVNINAPYEGILYASEALPKPFNPVQDDLRKYYDVGDYLVAKVVAFDRTKNPVLTIRDKGLGKITEGVVVEIKPPRIPRVIGKKGSMLDVLTSETGCVFLVAVNGRIWFSCSDPRMSDIVIRALRLIEEEAHTTGLTDRVKAFIKDEKKRLGGDGG